MAKKWFLSITLALLSLALNAQTIKFCFTSSPVLADGVIFYSKYPSLADFSVWAGISGYTDVDVCFVSKPNSTSIDIELVDTPLLAEHSLCITNNRALADITLCITSSIGLADVCLGLWDTPAGFTKDIYIKGINPKELSLETKIAIVYCLGLLEKSD